MKNVSELLYTAAENLVTSAKPGVFNPKELTTESLKKLIQRIELTSPKKRVREKQDKQLSLLREELIKREGPPKETGPGQTPPPARGKKIPQPGSGQAPDKKIKPTPGQTPAKEPEKINPKVVEKANESFGNLIRKQIGPSVEALEKVYDGWYPPDTSDHEKDKEFLKALIEDLTEEMSKAKLPETKETPAVKKASLVSPGNLLRRNTEYTDAIRRLGDVWESSLKDMARIYEKAGGHIKSADNIFMNVIVNDLKRLINSKADVKKLISDSLGTIDSFFDTVTNFFFRRRYSTVSEILRKEARKIS